jgi:GTP cyclohydrolase I
VADLSQVPYEELVAETLRRLGEDPDREGLKKTPERVAKSMAWLTGGYRIDPMELLNKAIFTEKHESMVLVRDIEIYSMCEHHMLPFFGKAHIAYIPDGRIVGLSKLARLVDVFSRRLQVQERMTDQIADAMQCTLKPLGVGIVIECYHLCMMMRGVQKQNSRTVTSAVRGVFRDDQKTRDEFLGLVLGGSGHR